MRQTGFRKSKIAKVHIAKAQLNMDDEVYRALLIRVAGKDSCSKMNERELDTVLSELRRLGFVETRRKTDAAAPPKPKADIEAMCRKINALLLNSGRTWEYAHSLAERMFNIKRVQWLNPRQIHKLVAALQIDANRRDK